jgi:hypothetical protein
MTKIEAIKEAETVQLTTGLVTDFVLINGQYVVETYNVKVATTK